MLMRRVRGSRARLIGVVLVVIGALVTGGLGGGWWWTDRQARSTAHRLADAATLGWAAHRQRDADDRRPPTGQAPPGIAGPVIAVVRIARFGAGWRMPVQRGTGTGVLRQGLGLYAGSPAPGERGNVAIAGHRTTWGAPLKHLDRMRPGDMVVIWTADARFDYRVVGSGVTSPSDISVIAPKVAGRRAMLTLTTCHPEFSARERLYIHAVLVDSASF